MIGEHLMKKILFLFLSLFSFQSFASYSENLFYLTADMAGSTFSNEQLQQIKNHAKSIDILAPQIYQLNENGLVWGSIDKRLLTIAKENNLKVMPLIINQNFNQEQFHLFLQSASAQENAMMTMVSLCQRYHFYGLQFDFENININDKKEFTRFFQLAAKRLHQNGFVISIAVVPRTSDMLFNDYDRWYFENWSGAYDYQSLGQSADFISIMSYDRHTSLTTPGPLAAIDWVEKTIRYLLKFVPAQKISLGIPDYSGYWFVGKLDPGNLSEKYTYRSKKLPISYHKVFALLTQFHQTLAWNNQWQSSYAMYTNQDRAEYLFVENAKSFQAKINLVKRYQLRGISVWKLGLEDPEMWRKVEPRS